MADLESEDPKAETEESFLATVRERYKLCVESDRDNRQRAREALAFRDLEQWDPKAKLERENDTEGPRPCLVVDKLNQHVNGVVNDERMNRPQMKARPADESGDDEVAKMYDGLLRHIQYRSQADIAYDTGFECAVDGGFGFFRVLTEYCDPMSLDQTFRIGRVRNRFSAYLDPERQMPDGSDSKYGYLLYKVQKKEFKREFGKDGEDALGSFEYEGKEFTDWYGEDWVIYAEYFFIKYTKMTIVELPDGRVVPQDEAAAAGVIIGMDVRSRETEIPKVYWSKVTGTKILDGYRPGGSGDNGVMAFDKVPIIEVVGNELDIEGRVKRSGMIRGAMDAQRVDNYATSAFIEQVALAPRSSYVAAVGQLEGQEAEWKSANRRNISVLQYNAKEVNGIALPPPRREQPPGIPTGWMAVLGQAEHNIQAAMGRYNASLGEESNEKSGRAINARQREGDVGSFHFSDNFSRSLRFAGQLIVNAIPKVMTRRQIVRTLGEDGTLGKAIIDPALCGQDGKPCAYAEQPNAAGGVDKIYNPGVGKYDVVVITGPSYTTRRLEATEFMSQIASAVKDPVTSQVITYLAVKYNDLPGADEAAKMIKKLLPPEILEDEEAGQDKEAMAQRREAQVKAAAQALGQREAQVNAAQQELEQNAQAAQEQEQKAKEALTKVQAEIAKLNEAQASVDNDKELLAMQKSLALKEIELARATLARERADFESKQELRDVQGKLILERMETKLGSINDAAEAQPATQ